MKHKYWIMILLVMVGLQFAVTPILACSGDFRETTLQEHVDNADVILAGRVTGTTTTSVYDAAYTIEVISYLKGEGPDAVMVTGYGMGGGDCLNHIDVGDRWLLLLDGNPVEDTVLHASYLQVYDAVWEETPQRLADITAIVGHEPTLPYSTPLWTRLKYWMYSPVASLAVVIAVPLGVVVGGVTLLSARRHRQSKKKNA